MPAEALAKLLEFLVALLFEGVLQFVLDLAFSAIWDWLIPDPVYKTTRRIGWTIIAMIVGGGVLGALTVAIAPERLFSLISIRGTSLVLSPLITGLLMQWYGSWRKSRGMEYSYFATFWGGALFAFSMAAVRFLLVQ